MLPATQDGGTSLGLFIIYAAFRAALQPLAVFAGLVSVGSFLWLSAPKGSRVSTSQSHRRGGEALWRTMTPVPATLST